MNNADRRRSLRSLRWLNEALLPSVNASGVLLFDRIFDDRSYLTPLLASLAVSHVTLICARALHLGTVVATTLSAMTTSLALITVHFGHTTTYGVVPTAHTLDVLTLEVEAAAELLQAGVAPLRAETGLLLFASVTFWVIAAMSDWFSNRLHAPGQALVPLAAITAFVSLLGTPENRIRVTAIVIVCGLLYVLTHRAATVGARSDWSNQPDRRTFAVTIAGGLAIAAAAMAVAVLGSPLLPGIYDQPVVQVGKSIQSVSEPLRVISPMVELRAKLVDQRDQQMFVVTADRPAYWRVTALEDFDGRVWRSTGSFVSAQGHLEAPYQARVNTMTLTQRFTIGSLGALWLPAAYQPRHISAISQTTINYEPESATLIVRGGGQSASNPVYEVVSEIPAATPLEIQRTLGETESNDIDPAYLALPSDFNPRVKALAEEIVKFAEDDYTKALTLQTYFRDNFVYDLNVAAGHSINRIEDFLVAQRGYCEQFSGTFAAMGRSVGLPTRVAIGFTAGDQLPESPDLYVVRGRHAHAWPEVYLSGVGWLGFEPTPGRGAPNAGYTGVEAAQDATPISGSQEAPGQLSVVSNPEVQTPLPTPTPDSRVTETTSATHEGALDSAPSRVPYILGMIIVVSIIAAWLTLVPSLRARQRRIRKERANRDMRVRVTLAWQELQVRLASINLERSPSETISEFSGRAARRIGRCQDEFDRMSDLVHAACYGTSEPSLEHAVEVETLFDRIDIEIQKHQTSYERYLHSLNPKPLFQIRDPIMTKAEQLAAGAGPSS